MSSLIVRNTNTWLWRAGRASSTSTISAPLVEGGASGTSPLDVNQRGAVIGEVIPIVFCRRVGDIGGVLISPPATEARFEDDATTAAVTASYHLVLSDGDIDSIQVRDVFQRSCRVGDYTQTYNRRAGTFVAGNFIDNSPNLEAPYYCGTGGSYDGLSTMAFSVTIPAGFDQWNRQVHCFIRGGVLVTRLLDSTLGPSNNVVDLALYLLQKTSRLNAAQIDSSLMMDAARFTNANGLWYNGVENQSANLRDWLNSTLNYFLLRSVRVNGKETFKPLLPYVPATGAINTNPVEWVFTFTEEHIVPGSFDIDYISLTERKPFCALMLWRQQPTDDIGIIRTSEVRYPGTAVDGPFEQYDLSKFCASEDHAWKAGTYIISRRRHITHSLTIQVKPDAFNPTLVDGDIVRVRLDRVASVGAASIHNYLYEVDRITKSIGGDIQIELTHFPVDSELRSVVALEVNSAVGGGVLLETGKTGVSCDVNSSTDTSVPEEEFTDDTDIDDGDGGFDEEDESPIPDPGPNNPGGLDGQLNDSLGPMERCPIPGGPGALAPAGVCAGAVVTRRLANIGDEGNAIVETGGDELYSIPLTPPEALGGSDWNGKSIKYSFTCPDGTEQSANPCESPRPRDGTYDTGGRGLFVTASQNLQGELRDCYPNTFINILGNGLQSGSTLTYTGVISLRVEFLDFTVNYSKTCDGPVDSFSVPAIIIYATRASGETIIFNGFGYTSYPYQRSLTYAVSERNLVVTFTDDPGNPVPIESLPKLS